MIVLLSCSISLSVSSANCCDLIPSTGERIYPDSTLISFDDLRIVNSKLIELNYEKQININLRNIISNDSIAIREYKTINDKLNKDCKKAIRQRNIFMGTAFLFFITSLVLLLK